MNRIFLLVICLLLSISGCWGQTVFRIDSLPAQGALLDKGWKWQAGDNPDWAKPVFNDSAWASINPTQDIHELPQIRKAGLGWLRIHLNVNSLLKNKIISIVSDQAVASEFYLDGQLIGNFGIVSDNPKNVKAYNPIGSNALHQILHFYTGNKDKHILAVRFAIQPTNEYREFWSAKNSFLKVNLFLSERIENNLIKENNYEKKDEFDITALDYFKSGLFFVLSILHLFIYFSYRTQKANLYFGISCCAGFIYFLVQPITEQYFHFLSEREFVIKIFWFFYFSRNLLMLTAIYSIFSYKKGVVFYMLAIFSILYLIFDNTNLLVPYYLGTLLVVLINLEATRISIVASKNKNLGSYLLLIGTFGYIIFMSASIIVVNQVANKLLLDLLFNAALISIPISITLFLAREFAQTTRSLAIKLVENENLYTEKQQILATQNETLEKQVTERTSALNQSLVDLKSTQTQLIQREKMASLGELTAGIAHEIQNPLNFVNNFSEVSTELTSELKEELSKGDIAEAQAIADDLSQNLQKITHHGSRASAIVKGMLEHSRTDTGERQLTNLNTLADEYLRLAYQGFRSKNNTFNASLVTDFAPNLPQVEVVPPEIGRVLLNLFNNAFYAVQQKQKTAPADYQPTVRISTKRTDNQVEIQVKDNGIGIPESVIAKIFQPFFTTKPTGEGTGLGLSLSYDILTKGHGGEMLVETKEGEGAEFVVTLPLHQ